MQRNTRAMRVVSAALVAALGSFSALPTVAIASTGETANESAVSFGGVSVVRTSDNTLSVNEGGHESTITVTEGDGTRTVTIVDSVTGESNRFVYDESTGTIYSSYTGNTIDASDATGAGGLSTLSRSTSRTYSFSYASIKSAVGTAASVASITGYFLGKTGAFAMEAGSVSTLGKILAGIGLVVPNDSNHGIRVTVTTTRYYRHGNSVAYRTTKNITGLSAY